MTNGGVVFFIYFFSIRYVLRIKCSFDFRFVLENYANKSQVLLFFTTLRIMRIAKKLTTLNTWLYEGTANGTFTVYTFY